MTRYALALLVVLSLPTLAFGFSFGTASGYDGASHLDAAPVEWLGESDGFADGVSWTSDFAVGALNTLSIDVTLDDWWYWDGDFQNLSIWADWNQNSIFDETEEILSLEEEFFAAGTQTILADIMVPDWAVTGTTWMRTRLTWYGEGPLDPYSDFFSGEVEDYQITVASGGPSPIPEPATVTLVGLGLAGMALIRRRNRKDV
jgi:hypothetical protein